MQHYSPCLTIVLALLSAAPGSSQESPTVWSNWRGPLLGGISPDGDPPLVWSETENVRFKVPIPGEGLASPIVWDDKVFVLTAVSLDEEAYEEAKKRVRNVFDSGQWPPDVEPVRQRFLVLALSRDDGSVVWQRTASERVPHESHYLDSSWANGSPLTDGERLYVHFGSNGTYAYRLDGELLWQTDLGDMTTRRGFGEGNSPALFGDSLIINWDHEENSFIVALDKRTGKERWRTERPGEVTSWSTPLVVEHGGKAQIVVAATGRSRGYDFATGKEIWSLGGMTVNAIPTPLHRDGVVYLTSGYRGSMLQAVALDKAQGELEGSEAVLWTRDRDTPYVASPLLYGDHLYYVKHFRNIFTNVDPETGEAHYTVRLPGMGDIYASPVAVKDRIYVFGRDGTAVVLRHGAELEVLAANSLDDGIDASPAIVGKRMYVRSRHFLYCLEEGAKGEATAGR